jgi:hypothetical protein
VTDFLTVLSACESCGSTLAPGARFCTRCGYGFPDRSTLPPRVLDMDAARTSWGSGGVSAWGPFELPLASDERPMLWTSDDRSPFLLTARGARGVVYRLALSPAGVRADLVISDLSFEDLRHVCVTPSGVFAVDDSGLTAARSDGGAGWILNSQILPQDVSVVGMARGPHGHLMALAKSGDHLRLYAGRGMTQLKLQASGPAPEADGWLDMAVDERGSLAFWGSGVLGRMEGNRLVLQPDARAPQQPLSLNDRGSALTLHGAARPSRQGACPVSADCPAGWGLVSAAAGCFVEAPEDLKAPLSVTGLGDDASVLLRASGPPTLARIDSPSAPLTAIPMGGWGRDVPIGGAVSALDDAVLGLLSTGASSDAFLLRTDEARKSLGLASRAHFDVGRRSAPSPIPSLPPLALIGGVAVGMVMDQLTIWLAPWSQSA